MCVQQVVRERPLLPDPLPVIAWVPPGQVKQADAAAGFQLIIAETAAQRNSLREMGIAASRIASTVDADSDRTTFSYDAANRRTVERQNDGSRTSMTYDAADQQLGVIERDLAAATTGRLTYSYDAAGIRTGRPSGPTHPCTVAAVARGWGPDGPSTVSR